LCSTYGGCRTFNYWSSTHNCQLFTQPSTSYGVVSGCSAYSEDQVVIGASDCLQILHAYPSIPSGAYAISVGPNNVNVQVYCDMTTAGGGWTVFQRRQDGSVDFFRNWADYAAGFGTVTAEHWLGNDNIALITSEKNYSLRIDMQDWDGEKRQANYSSFAIGNASTNYKLIKLGTFNADDGTGDGLTYSRNSAFRTVDRDNDLLLIIDCAKNLHSGYWFKGGLNLVCSLSNLNGQYNNTDLFQGVNWNPWRGAGYSLKFVEMKMRPV